MSMFLMSMLLMLMVQLRASARNCTDVYPYELDVGLYQVFLQRDELLSGSEVDVMYLEYAKVCEPSADGKNAAYIVHGAQPGRVLASERFGMDEDDFVILLTPWLRRGWNVYMFMWTQFADEQLANFMRAEAKIWDANWFVDMEYLVLNGDKTEVLFDQSGLTIAQMLASEITMMEGDASRAGEGRIMMDTDASHEGEGKGTQNGGEGEQKEIRLIGHSLGTQLTVATAIELLGQGFMRDNPHIRIRLAMLDSVFSPYRQGYMIDNPCGATIGEAMGCMINELSEHGVAIEAYKTSFINPCIFSAKHHLEIMEHIAFAEVRMNEWGDASIDKCVIFDDIFGSAPSKLVRNIEDSAIQMYNQHVHVVAYYLLSLAYPPHLLKEDAIAAGIVPADFEGVYSVSLSAAMQTETVLAMMDYKRNGKKQCFIQIDDGGRFTNSSTMTIIPYDDLYSLENCANAKL